MVEAATLLGSHRQPSDACPTMLDPPPPKHQASSPGIVKGASSDVFNLSPSHDGSSPYGELRAENVPIQVWRVTRRKLTWNLRIDPWKTTPGFGGPCESPLQYS